MALRAGARIIGVNNRNLKDFSVNTDNSRRLRELVPPQVLFVSESGVITGNDVKRLREKLEGVSDKWSLKTVWGVGYKFEVKDD